MPVFEYNISWMVYNSFLAFLAVGFGIFYLQSKWLFFKAIWITLWLLFLPNTIYIFTDLEHLVYQWNYVDPAFHFALIMQYVCLATVGLITFLVAFLPLENIIHRMHFSKKKGIHILIMFNFLIAFGLVLGRVERLNSWNIFTKPESVIASAMHVLTSFNLLGLTVLFGILCNCTYFLFRNVIIHNAKKFF